MAKSYLTKKQITVLKLRQQGLTLEEIARKLRVTKQNVHLIEKTANKNIAKAERTLKMARLIKAPIWLTIRKGESLGDVIGMIYKKADGQGIHIIYNGPSLEFKVMGDSAGRIRGREVVGKMKIGITRGGDVIIV